MTHWRYNEPGPNNTHVTVTLSEDEILAEFYPYWCDRMRRVGKLLLCSEAACIEDWGVVHWAWKVCLDFKPDHNGECLNCDEWYDAHEELHRGNT